MDANTLETLSDTLIAMTALVTIFGGSVWLGLVALRGRYRVRSRIVERGLAVDPFAHGTGRGIRRWGIGMLGAGVGLLAGHAGARFAGMDPVTAYAAGLALGLGGAMLATWKLELTAGGRR